MDLETPTIRELMAAPPSLDQTRRLLEEVFALYRSGLAENGARMAVGARLAEGSARLAVEPLLAWAQAISEGFPDEVYQKLVAVLGRRPESSEPSLEEVRQIADFLKKTNKERKRPVEGLEGRPASFGAGKSDEKVGLHLDAHHELIQLLLRDNMIDGRTAVILTYFAEMHDLAYNTDAKDEGSVDLVRDEALIRAALGRNATAAGYKDEAARSEAVTRAYDFLKKHSKGPEQGFVRKILGHGSLSVIPAVRRLTALGLTPDQAMGLAMIFSSHHPGFPITFVANDVLGKNPNPAFAAVSKEIDELGIAPVLLIGPVGRPNSARGSDSLRRRIARAGALLLGGGKMSKKSADVLAAFCFMLDRFVPYREWFKRAIVVSSNITDPAKMTVEHLLELNALAVEREMLASVGTARFMGFKSLTRILKQTMARCLKIHRDTTGIKDTKAVKRTKGSKVTTATQEAKGMLKLIRKHNLSGQIEKAKQDLALLVNSYPNAKELTTQKDKTYEETVIAALYEVLRGLSTEDVQKRTSAIIEAERARRSSSAEITGTTPSQAGLSAEDEPVVAEIDLRQDILKLLRLNQMDPEIQSFTIPPGGILYRQGDQANLPAGSIGVDPLIAWRSGYVYVIEDHFVYIDVNGKVIAHRFAGDILGEAAAVTGNRRTATVTAGPVGVTVLAIPNAMFKAALEAASPEVREHIKEIIAERARLDFWSGINLGTGALGSERPTGPNSPVDAALAIVDKGNPVPDAMHSAIHEEAVQKNQRFAEFVEGLDDAVQERQKNNVLAPPSSAESDPLMVFRALWIQKNKSFTEREFGELWAAYKSLGDYEALLNLYQTHAEDQAAYDPNFSDYILSLNRTGRMNLALRAVEDRLRYYPVVNGDRATQTIVSELHIGRGTAYKNISFLAEALDRQLGLLDGGDRGMTADEQAKLVRLFRQYRHYFPEDMVFKKYSKGGVLRLNRERLADLRASVRRNQEAAMRQSELSYQTAFDISGAYYPAMNLVRTLVYQGRFDEARAWAPAVERATFPGDNQREFWVATAQLEAEILTADLSRSGDRTRLHDILANVLREARVPSEIQSLLTYLRVWRGRLVDRGLRGPQTKLLDDLIRIIGLRADHPDDRDFHTTLAATAPNPKDAEYAALLEAAKAFNRSRDESRTPAERVRKSAARVDGYEPNTDLINNFSVDGAIASTKTTHMDFLLAFKVIKSLRVNGHSLDQESDPEVVNRVINAYIDAWFGLINKHGIRDLEDLEHPRHKKHIDDFFTAYKKMAGAGLEVEADLSPMIALMFGRGDCRATNHAKILLMGEWNRLREKKSIDRAIAELKRVKNGSPRKIQKIADKVRKMMSRPRIEILLLEAKMFGAAEVEEGGKLAKTTLKGDPKGQNRLKLNEEEKQKFLENHALTLVMRTGSDGRMLSLKAACAWYRDKYYALEWADIAHDDLADMIKNGFLVPKGLLVVDKNGRLRKLDLRLVPASYSKPRQKHGSGGTGWPVFLGDFLRDVNSKYLTDPEAHARLQKFVNAFIRWAEKNIPDPPRAKKLLVKKTGAAARMATPAGARLAKPGAGVHKLLKEPMALLDELSVVSKAFLKLLMAGLISSGSSGSAFALGADGAVHVFVVGRNGMAGQVDSIESEAWDRQPDSALLTPDRALVNPVSQIESSAENINIAAANLWAMVEAIYKDNTITSGVFVVDVADLNGAAEANQLSDNLDVLRTLVRQDRSKVVLTNLMNIDLSDKTKWKLEEFKIVSSPKDIYDQNSDYQTALMMSPDLIKEYYLKIHDQPNLMAKTVVSPIRASTMTDPLIDSVRASVRGFMTIQANAGADQDPTKAAEALREQAQVMAQLFQGSRGNAAVLLALFMGSYDSDDQIIDRVSGMAFAPLKLLTELISSAARMARVVSAAA